MESAVIYARQSSGSDDYSESVEVQIRNCRELAKKSDLQVIGIFQDLNISGKTYPEGWEILSQNDLAFQSWFAEQSGMKRSRKGLGDLFRLLPVTDYIIVDDITRLYRPLSRSFLEAAVNQRLFEHHVRVLQVKGGMVDFAQFDQQLITMLKNQINDEQISKQRLKSIEVLNRLRDSGIMPTGVTAWGLRYDAGTKRISADPEKLPVIRFIFAALKAEQPYNQIVQEVNQNWPHLFRTCFWEKSLYQIARKPIYAGCQYDTAGNLIKNRQWDGVVSLNDWRKVQEVMRERRLQGGKHHCNRPGENCHWLPLSGLLFCANCGSRLVAVVDRGRISYRCQRGYLSGHPACRESRIMVECDRAELVGLLPFIRQALPLGLFALEKRWKRWQEDFVRRSEWQHRAGTLEERLLRLNGRFAAGELSEEAWRGAAGPLTSELEAMRREPPPGEVVSAEELERERERLETLRRCFRKHNMQHEMFEELLRHTLLRVEVGGDFIRLIPADPAWKLPDFRRCRRGRFTGFARSEMLRLWRQVRKIAREDLS